jgi:hypothetical protein
MKAKSWRHHYLQQFLIKGFLNENNKVFVYNKELDEIQKKEKSSKSIFFEENKNTIFFENGNSTSTIEDLLYMKKDDTFGKLIIELQSSDLRNENLLNDKKISDFASFIIDLFWRIPHTDEVAKKIIDEALRKRESEISEKDSFYKQYRSLLYQLTLNNPEKLKNKKVGFFTKVFDIKNNILILGDNPIVYEKEPESYDDLFDLDYCVAISSNRIVMQSLKEIEFFCYSKVMDYNSLVIEQSNKYVCSGNRVLLQACIDYNKNVKKLDLESEFRRKIFNKQKTAYNS